MENQDEIGRNVLNTEGQAISLAQEFSAKLSDLCINFNGCVRHGYEYIFGDGSILHVKLNVWPPATKAGKSS
jgi:hypothetical protein